jgi:pimeloyl-ACP methyl ester carboxylesterase
MTTESAAHAFSSGFVADGAARLYFEVAGRGVPVVLLHAGVADSRQWNNEFAWLSMHHRVVRHDLRGYGRSEPADGEFSHRQGLQRVLATAGITEPAWMIGCSMGGTLAMDYALEYPDRVRGLVMVGSGPSGLKLAAPRPELFKTIERASEAGNLDLVAELETQLWFDGTGRTADQVDQGMRALAYAMNRLALQHEARSLGTQVPDGTTSAAQRLHQLRMPVLSIVGEHDIPYIHLATDHLVQHVVGARKVLLQNAAHLPNMDQPAAFRLLIEEFTVEAGHGILAVDPS